MGWLDNKHKRLDEEADALEVKEYLKLEEKRITNGELINFDLDQDFDFDNVYEFDI
jgi:hypothetical protein